MFRLWQVIGFRDGTFSTAACWPARFPPAGRHSREQALLERRPGEYAPEQAGVYEGGLQALLARELNKKFEAAGRSTEFLVGIRRHVSRPGPKPAKIKRQP